MCAIHVLLMAFVVAAADLSFAQAPATSFTLDFVPDETLAPEFRAATSNPDGPSLFTALEEQLCSKLESTKSDIDFVIVDSVSQPEPD